MLSQAGCVEKFVDALVWVLFPVYLHGHGLSLVEIGYGIGALLLGLIVDSFGALEAGFWFTSAAMALSGLWVALAMVETMVSHKPVARV